MGHAGRLAGTSLECDASPCWATIFSSCPVGSAFGRRPSCSHPSHPQAITRPARTFNDHPARHLPAVPAASRLPLFLGLSPTDFVLFVSAGRSSSLGRVVFPPT